jgi:hypothetical protein
MMHLTVGAFRLSLCLGRIFILVSQNEKKTLTKWRHPGCTGSTFECYFKPVSGCVLTEQDIVNAITIKNGLYADELPYINQKVLRLDRYPTTTGICRICGDAWTGDLSLFEGLSHGNLKYFYQTVEEANSDFGNIDTETKDLLHFSVFKNSIRLFWTSIFMRYLIRPRPWFSGAIQQTSYQSLVLGGVINTQAEYEFEVTTGDKNINITDKKSNKYESINDLNKNGNENNNFFDFNIFGEDHHGNGVNINETANNLNEMVISLVDEIPQPFLSMHVRYVLSCRLSLYSSLLYPFTHTYLTPGVYVLHIHTLMTEKRLLIRRRDFMIPLVVICLSKHHQH